MLRTQTNHVAFDAVNRVGVSLFVFLVGSLVFSAESAFAASILSDYSITSTDLQNSLERDPGEIGLVESSSRAIDECGCGSVPTGARTQALPIDEPSNQESPSPVGFAPANNRGGMTSSEASPTGGFNGSAAAMLGVAFDRPVGELIAWLRIESLLDIPPAPPFELLRPPQISWI